MLCADNSQADSDYQGLRDTTDPLVEQVVANGVSEVVAAWTTD